MIKNTEIRLIDFGNATFDYQYHTSVVSTRYYRAPEVILKLEWAQPCDVWSIGCSIFELYLGSTLFITNNDLEHLAIMQRILGLMASLMTRRSMTGYYHCDKLNWDKSSQDGQFVTKNFKSFKKYMKSQKEDDKVLFNLIYEMLRYLPFRRITTESFRPPVFYKLPDHQRLHDKDK